jgi:hypothetical protein
MNFEVFSDLVKTQIIEEAVFTNPGGGTSTISKVKPDRIVYKRGNSRMTMHLSDLHNVYTEFGSIDKLTSTDLKLYKPEVFDSKGNGHSCNCTFTFMVLNKLGLSTEIFGKGVRGNPFFVTFFATNA